MTKRFKVVVTDFLNDDFILEKEILDDIADIIPAVALKEEDLIGIVEDADALIVYHSISLTEKSLSRLNQCRIISRGGVGCDNIDWEFARGMGIDVTNIPDYGTEEVADSAIGMMLTLTRGIHFQNSLLKRQGGDWSYTHTAPLVRLRGQVIGIVGLGRIGTATSIRAKSLGMKVVYYDPYKPLGYDKSLGVTRAETLDELLAQSLAVSLHCPLTEETHHLMNAATIESMPDRSYLINAARGGVVDVQAIPPALEAGKLAGVAIDVLEKEPPNEDDPLVLAWRNPDHPAHDRLILNPHAAFYCEEGLDEIRRKGAENCRRALLGQPVHNVVN
ncbi:MAG: C-terminal binding protein [Candidatus Omnitrophica bacterium]|nr:C-terminal binding protein [Candidatus Omnitrophota bacterium]